MQKRIALYLKKNFSGINHVALAVALIASLALWYLNKLGDSYTATITLPVRIENSVDSRAGVLENRNEVECRVKGTGYELLRYRMFPRRNAVTIPLGNIELQPMAGTNRSAVVLPSLYNALSAQMAETTDIQLLSIVTPRIEVATAPLQSKKVPVRNLIEVNFQHAFRAVGEMRFTPDVVEVRSLDPLLDTLQAVYTEPREYNRVSGSLSGRIALQPIPDVIFSVVEVEFDLGVEPIPVPETDSVPEP